VLGALYQQHLGIARAGWYQHDSNGSLDSAGLADPLRRVRRQVFSNELKSDPNQLQ
jgi:hypothetical protein